MVPDPAVERLRALLRVPTVAGADRFEELHEVLAREYPLVHDRLERERVGDSLLFRWPGSGGPVVVLMAHLDVVPAVADGWSHPPFDGVVTGEGDDAVLWGRGALDDKGSVAAILEAVEDALRRGLQPSGDLYLSFGADEETMGDGARGIVDLLERRGVRPELVLDEGGAVIESPFPGVRDPLAVVGVSEKGILNLRLSVDQQGGHASTPPRRTATARIARAVLRISKRPFPARFGTVSEEMVRRVGRRATGPMRALFARPRLTRPLLLALFLRAGDETRAAVRTTAAVTQLSGSEAANALAERAGAVVNVRIAVGSSVAQAVARIRRVIADPGVRLEVLTASEPSPVSPTTGAAWEMLSGTIERAFPGVIVAPYVMLGASDSRHFTRICPAVYRFSPFEMSREERGSLHATDERIRVRSFLGGVAFYRLLLTELATRRG